MHSPMLIGTQTNPALSFEFCILAFLYTIFKLACNLHQFLIIRCSINCCINSIIKWAIWAFICRSSLIMDESLLTKISRGFSLENAAVDGYYIVSGSYLVRRNCENPIEDSWLRFIKKALNTWLNRLTCHFQTLTVLDISNRDLQSRHSP